MSLSPNLGSRGDMTRCIGLFAIIHQTDPRVHMAADLITWSSNSSPYPSESRLILPCKEMHNINTLTKNILEATNAYKVVDLIIFPVYCKLYKHRRLAFAYHVVANIQF